MLASRRTWSLLVRCTGIRRRPAARWRRRALCVSDTQTGVRAASHRGSRSGRSSYGLSVRHTHSTRRISMAHLGGSASVEIDAPVAKVWAVVEDVITAPQWQGGLDAMTALE